MLCLSSHHRELAFLILLSLLPVPFLSARDFSIPPADSPTTAPLVDDTTPSERGRTPGSLQEALTLLEKDRKVPALRFMKNWILENPESERAVEVFKKIAASENDLDQSVAFTRELLARHPYSPPARYAYFELGGFYLLKRDFQRAVSAYSDFLRLNPHSPLRPEAGRRLAGSLMSLGKYEAALRQWNTLRNDNPDFANSPDITDAIAGCEIARGNTGEALKLLRYIVNKFPNYPYLPKVYLNLGLCYEDRGLYEIAREWYGELVRLFPGSLEKKLAQSRINDIDRTLPPRSGDDALSH